MTTSNPSVTTAVQNLAATVLVSADTHVGPTMAQLRPYCDRGHLDDFDAFASNLERGELAAPAIGSPASPATGVIERVMWNLQTEGHHDMTARLRDYDADGVAAGVLFHGSLNGMPIPFQTDQLSLELTPGELQGVGLQIYNRWLADECASNPSRHIGLAQIPFWDIDATVREVRWAKEAGLRGINFPSMRLGLPEYDQPHWDPLWAAAQDLGLPLVNHGGGSPQQLTGPGGVAMHEIENGEFFGRRSVWWLLFAGVFERFPGLKLVLTEQPGTWFHDVARRLDSVYFNMAARVVQEYLPLLPSEYMHRQVFIGGSFLSHTEVLDAIEHDYVDNVMWGSDYPHPEGTYLYPGSAVHGDEPGACNKAHLRMTFAGTPESVIRAICGFNAARVYDLDLDRLGEIARDIDAPTPAEMATGLDHVPLDADNTHAFRTRGPWS
jgi:predicted TIM-barrel fold metal-dependent hydrolase